VDDGFSNEQGRKMEDGDDLVEHIQGFENLLRELRELAPAEEMDSSKYSNPVDVSRCLAKGLPFKYISQLQVIKFITAGVNEARNGVDREDNSSGTLGVGSYSKLKYPPFDEFKALLLSIHESEGATLEHSARDNRRGTGGIEKKKTPMFMIGQQDSSNLHHSTLNPTGKVSEGCWDCDSTDPRRGDSMCPHPGSLAFAPARLQKKSRGIGSDSSNMGAGAGHGGGEDSKICYLWKQGFCKYADRCKFLHPDGSSGLNSNNRGSWKGRGKGKGKSNKRGKGKGKGKVGEKSKAYKVFLTKEAFEASMKARAEKGVKDRVASVVSRVMLAQNRGEQREARGEKRESEMTIAELCEQEIASGGARQRMYMLRVHGSDSMQVDGEGSGLVGENSGGAGSLVGRECKQCSAVF